MDNTTILVGKDGPQRIRTSGKRWSERAEKRFLDHLAATCNITASAEKAGFSRAAIYKRRRKDPAFARLWDAAVEHGYARIEALLVQRATETLEGFVPDPDTPIPVMTVKDAITILGHHRRSVLGGPRSRRQWARPRSLDEMRDSILRKLEAIAPTPPPSSRRPRHPGNRATSRTRRNETQAQAGARHRYRRLPRLARSRNAACRYRAARRA